MTDREKQPLRVLQVLGGTGLGGAESRVMDLYRNMDRSAVQFDFAVHSRERGHFDAEIEALGGRIYRLPRFRVYNLLAYRRAWKRFFAAHPGYRAVHGHMTSTASLYLPIAKKAGVPLAVAHARSAGVDGGLKGRITRALRQNLWKKADRCLTCSELAGRAVFGDRAWEAGSVRTVPNAIDVEAFSFCPDVRERMRRRLGLEGCFVVGHVGRFNPMKNHGFLLEVFACIAALRPDSALLLLGEGGGMAEAKQRAQELGVADKVYFLGNRADAANFYQAMDFFVFPSLYEGLPGTVLEAQAAGLPCLISDTVTREAGVTPLAEYRSLAEGAQGWAARVLERAEKADERGSGLSALREAGFDVKEQAARMQRFYETGSWDD